MPCCPKGHLTVEKDEQKRWTEFSQLGNRWILLAGVSSDTVYNNQTIARNISIYYMDKGILLATETLVESIRHYIRDPSGVFSVCHAREWYNDKFPPFWVFFFSKWPTSSRFVELSEDDIYHFCEQ